MSAATTLSVGDIVSNGIAIGMKNFVNLLIAGILWAVTFWIPYLNLGTTIGLIDIVVKMSRGESIGATDIFDPKYRTRIGEFFLLIVFYIGGTLASYPFVGAGAVLQMAWMLGPYIFVDNDEDPIEALKTSNRLMYGNKLSVFMATLVVVAVPMVVVLIGSAMNSMIVMFIAFLLYLCVMPVMIGISAYVYKTLGGGGASAEAAPAV